MTSTATLYDVAVPRFPVEQWRLRNGLRVIVQPDGAAPLVGSLMCYPGSRIDPASRSGLAHVCEHLAFDGPRTASGGPFPARIEHAGGSTLAVTTTDRMCFSAIVPRTELPALVTLEAQRMAEPLDAHDDEALEIQRRVVLEELQERSLHRVRATAFEQLHRLLFVADHPYHRPASGEPEAIRAVTLDDVRAAVRARFVPGAAVLALVGDVSVRVADEISAAFEALPAGDEPADVARAGSVPQGLRTSVRPAAVAEPQAFLGWSVAGVGQDDFYLAALLMRALAVGRSSPLAQALIEHTGVAQEVSGHLVPMRDASTLVFAAGAARGVEAARLGEALLAAVDGLLARGVAPADLARARKRALRDYHHAVQGFERRADLCVALAGACDAPERVADEPRRYLTPDEGAVGAFAARLRRTPSRALLSFVPAAVAA